MTFEWLPYAIILYIGIVIGIASTTTVFTLLDRKKVDRKKRYKYFTRKRKDTGLDDFMDHR